MLRAYLSEIELPPGAKALEIGCGTGAVSRALVEWLKLEVTGLDPSPIFVSRAQDLGGHLPNLTFMQGDGRSLTLTDASFDLVVFHTTLCHIPNSGGRAARSLSRTSSGRLVDRIRWRLHDDDSGDQRLRSTSASRERNGGQLRPQSMAYATPV